LITPQRPFLFTFAITWWKVVRPFFDAPSWTAVAPSQRSWGRAVPTLPPNNNKYSNLSSTNRLGIIRHASSTHPLPRLCHYLDNAFAPHRHQDGQLLPVTTASGASTNFPCLSPPEDNDTGRVCGMQSHSSIHLSQNPWARRVTLALTFPGTTLVVHIFSDNVRSRFENRSEALAHYICLYHSSNLHEA